MSGGSYNYMYSSVEDEYVGHMYDAELDELMRDLVPVLKAVEWWQSCDTCEKTYRDTVTKFKKKWLSGDVRQKVLEQIISDKVDELKYDLLKMIGIVEYDKYGEAIKKDGDR